MDTISITPDLLNKFRQLLEQNDAVTAQNPAFKLQYLSAIMGIWLAELPGAQSDKETLLEQLTAFTQHVMSEQANQPAPAAAPR